MPPGRRPTIAPEPVNILLTCAGRRVALLDVFRRALGKLGLAGAVLAADASPTSAACQLADAAVCVPPVTSDEYIPTLCDAVRDHAVRLIVPTTDLDLATLAAAQDTLAELGCTVQTPPAETLTWCRDKSAAMARLAEAHLRVPRTVSLAEFREQPFYPCFVKPTRGSASIGARHIADEDQLQVHLRAHGSDVIVQEYVGGREYTIDVYRDLLGQARCVVPRQRLAVRSGEVEKGLTVRDESLIADARRICDLLDGMWGVFCCQCRREPDQQRGAFFEINPRFGGGVTLSIAAGADLAEYLLRELIGRDLPDGADTFTENLLMVRYDQDAFVRLAAADAAALPGYDQPTFR